MDNLTALLVLQSKYLKIADYALQQLDKIQAAIKIVEDEGAKRSQTEKSLTLIKS